MELWVEPVALGALEGSGQSVELAAQEVLEESVAPAGAAGVVATQGEVVTVAMAATAAMAATVESVRMPATVATVVAVDLEVPEAVVA